MDKSKEGIPKKWLAHYAERIIAISPGKDGEIEQLLLEDNESQGWRRSSSHVSKYVRPFLWGYAASCDSKRSCFYKETTWIY